MFDRSKSGAINFQEFIDVWKYVSSWQQTFRSCDKDNSGFIDRNELRMAITNFGYTLSENFYNVMLRKFDRQKNDKIYFDDFIQCCVSLQMLTNVFKSKDTRGMGQITVGFEEFLTMVYSVNMG